MDVGRIVGNAVELSLKETSAPKHVELAEDTLTPEIVSLEEVSCTLHISDEGYRRLEQSRQDEGFPVEEKIPPAETAVSADTVDESAEEEKMSSIEQLSQFADRLIDVMRNTQRHATKDTEMEKLEALEQMRQLKEEQEDEYRRQVEEAQAMATKRSKTKNIVEKGKRDLRSCWNPLSR